ncbi:hypothetical protein H4Q26_015961 [Puccinia striiformis f. sp. tritici PST-130]|nr:hypothetical protein H4Q26_015961 [Puccinia striiformis f. sp. tritici PST-130]
MTETMRLPSFDGHSPTEKISSMTEAVSLSTSASSTVDDAQLSLTEADRVSMEDELMESESEPAELKKSSDDLIEIEAAASKLESSSITAERCLVGAAQPQENEPTTSTELLIDQDGFLSKLNNLKQTQITINSPSRITESTSIDEISLMEDELLIETEPLDQIQTLDELELFVDLPPADHALSYSKPTSDFKSMARAFHQNKSLDVHIEDQPELPSIMIQNCENHSAKFDPPPSSSSSIPYPDPQFISIAQICPKRVHIQSPTCSKVPGPNYQSSGSTGSKSSIAKPTSSASSTTPQLGYLIRPSIIKIIDYSINPTTPKSVSGLPFDQKVTGSTEWRNYDIVNVDALNGSSAKSSQDSVKCSSSQAQPPETSQPYQTRKSRFNPWTGTSKLNVGSRMLSKVPAEIYAKLLSHTSIFIQAIDLRVHPITLRRRLRALVRNCGPGPSEHVAQRARRRRKMKIITAQSKPNNQTTEPVHIRAEIKANDDQDKEARTSPAEEIEETKPSSLVKTYPRTAQSDSTLLLKHHNQSTFSLNLNSLHLSELSENQEDYDNLTTKIDVKILNLSHNQFTKFPTGIISSFSSSLTMLNLSRNRMKSIDDDDHVYQLMMKIKLPELIEFNLSSNS